MLKECKVKIFDYELLKNVVLVELTECFDYGGGNRSPITKKPCLIYSVTDTKLILIDQYDNKITVIPRHLEPLFKDSVEPEYKLEILYTK